MHIRDLQAPDKLWSKLHYYHGLLPLCNARREASHRPSFPLPRGRRRTSAHPSEPWQECLADAVVEGKDLSLLRSLLQIRSVLLSLSRVPYYCTQQLKSIINSALMPVLAPHCVNAQILVDVSCLGCEITCGGVSVVPAVFLWIHLSVMAIWASANMGETSVHRISFGILSHAWRTRFGQIHGS